MARPALALVFALLPLSCSDSPLPGSVLGTYQVTGQPQANSCGLGAPDPWSFQVMLSEQGSTLYWSWMDGTPMLQGALSAAQATLTENDTTNADPTDAGLGPCNLQRALSVQVALGAGSPPPTFSGTIGYAFSVPAGSDCTDQLTSSGGTFDALPCTMTYSLSAAHQ
jgi:hypothetical protein